MSHKIDTKQLSFVENLQNRTVSFSDFECHGQLQFHPEEGNLEVSKQAMEEAVPRLQYQQEIPQEVWQLKVLGPDTPDALILTHTKTEMEGMYLDVFGSFEAHEPRRKKQTSDGCGRHVVLDLRRVRMRSPIRSSA